VARELAQQQASKKTMEGERTRSASQNQKDDAKQLDRLKIKHHQFTMTAVAKHPSYDAIWQSIHSNKKRMAKHPPIEGNDSKASATDGKASGKIEAASRLLETNERPGRPKIPWQWK